LNISQMPVYLPKYNKSVANLKAQLAEPALADAWSAGQALSLDKLLFMLCAALSE